MQRFWRWLGLNLGKHWITVLVVGGVATLAIGYGATKLQFSTSQDVYLNTSDQVYKDSVAYQNLFGGEAMVVLVTMDPGHTVSELFTPSDIVQWQRFAAELHRSGQIDNVVTPLTALQFNEALVSSPTGDVTQSVAGKILLDTTARDPSPTSQALRNADAARTLQRIDAIPVAQRTISNPAYLDFLLHDNQGQIRKPLLPNFPDDHHAQVIVRLPGNESIKTEGAASVYIQQLASQLRLGRNDDGESPLVAPFSPHAIRHPQLVDGRDDDVELRLGQARPVIDHYGHDRRMFR